MLFEEEILSKDGLDSLGITFANGKKDMSLMEGKFVDRLVECRLDALSVGIETDGKYTG